jgi:hypothetical protein
MAKGDIKIFTFMALDKRPLDLGMECKRKGDWSAQREFWHPIKLTPSLFNLQVGFYFKIFLVFTLQAPTVLCFVLASLFITLHFVLKLVLHCVFIMLFIIHELLLLHSLCNVYVHHVAIAMSYGSGTLKLWASYGLLMFCDCVWGSSRTPYSWGIITLHKTAKWLKSRPLLSGSKWNSTHARRMGCGQETFFHCIPMPELTTVLSYVLT